MTNPVQSNPTDELGTRSNWQTGRGESPSSKGKAHPPERDTSHLADLHAAGSSPCPSDMNAFKKVQTTGK